jgi:transmembrane sensor
MSRLRFPLKDHLQDPADEEALCRMAEAIDSRAGPRKRRRLLPLVLVGATAVAALVVASSLIRRDTGPLLFADGRELVAIDAGGTAKEIALSDGSRIRLSAGTRLEPLQSSGTSFSAVVTGGRADFEVRPGGRRHWVIECGLASVEVLGTAFACEREPGRLRVVVRHGVVLVRGELVPDRARRVAAGETLDVVEDASHAGPAGGTLGPLAASQNLGASAPVTPEAALGPADSEGSNLRSRPSAGRTWRELARHGRNGEAFAALGAEGLRRESRKLGVKDLLALADVARLSGHPTEAVVPLGRILSEFPNDAQAPLAAFALGRLELDSLGHAQAAVAAFRKALALGIPRSLREDVTARLVEAYARSGNAGEARRVADTYLAEFPSGRHVRAIEGWLHLR